MELTAERHSHVAFRAAIGLDRFLSNAELERETKMNFN